MLKTGPFSHSACVVPSHQTSSEFHLVSPRHRQGISHLYLKSSLFLLVMVHVNTLYRQWNVDKVATVGYTSLKTDINFKDQVPQKKESFLNLCKT